MERVRSIFKLLIERQRFHYQVRLEGPLIAFIDQVR